MLEEKLNQINNNIMKLKKLGIFFLGFALLMVSSCDDDDDADVPGSGLEGLGTVFSVIDRNSASSALVAALETAPGDLPATLNGEGPFTVFAPNNDAFEALATAAGFESAEELLAEADPTLLSQILTYHVVPGENLAANLSNGTSLTTVLGDNLTVIVDDEGTVQLQDATKLPETNPVSVVVRANGFATNGVVHFVDKVLLPQVAVEALDIDIRPSVVEWAVATDDLSSLVSALGKAGLVETVSELDTVTVLAPTNQAFNNLLEALGDDYETLDDFDNDFELGLLANILTYHALPVRVGSGGLMPGEVETLFEDNTVEVIAEGESFTFGDATGTNAGIVTADVDGNNGFVHIIDKVLLPQAALDFLDLLGSDDLATTVIDNPQLSVLEEALIATDLVDAFVDATNTAMDLTATNFTYFRPATVFAPTDAAFTDLLNLLGDDYTGIDSFDTEDELELLTEILLYHVVPGNITSEDLEPGDVTTASGSDIEIISIVGTTDFSVGDATNDLNANIAIADVEARNGVAHVIDKVLLPQSAVDFINSLNEEEEE